MRREKRLEAVESRAGDGPFDVVVDPTISREEAQAQRPLTGGPGPREFARSALSTSEWTNVDTPSGQRCQNYFFGQNPCFGHYS